MDTMNMIFENYGGKRITQIFKTYWMALLILKQVMFSLFPASPTMEPSPVNSIEKIQEDAAIKTQENNLTEFDFIKLIITLTQLKSDELTEAGCAPQVQP
ncbi:hypothetical protein [Salinimicrobium soli]|uniref:hypothetical protein n=1 Tax=Salinimicrobium soli TaxID=1254399 RepID=UPI003AAEE5D0